MILRAASRQMEEGQTKLTAAMISGQACQALSCKSSEEKVERGKGVRHLFR